ncbi:hypothetical protein [Arthrobacter sp. UYEF21]|uniref:hypothetical protein n=1 Tax=Arthrobacter sp. UYEF21 TaxID=1756364 RepID=UPI0033986B8A
MNNKLTAQQASAIMIIRQEARHLGLTIPADAATTPQAVTLTAPSADEITAAVAKALTAGKDPGKDPAVQALVTTAYLANLPGVSAALEANRDQEALAAFQQAAPAINDQLAELFAADAATLERNKDAVGSQPLAYLDPNSMNLNAGKAALEIIDANKRIAKVVAVWRTLHHMLTNVSENPYSKALVFGNPTFQRWDDNRLRIAKPDAWDLVLMGVELSLAEDPDEVAARFQSLEQAQVQYDAEAREFQQFGYGGRAAHIAGNKTALDNLAAGMKTT